MPFLGTRLIELLAHPRFSSPLPILKFYAAVFSQQKGAYAEARQISLPLAATQLPRAKARRSLNLSFGQELDTRQKLAGRLANPASQHAKIAAVIAQKLQNIVSDGLRALAQKQLLQKGENFALMRQRAAVVGIKVKPGHNRSEAFSASSSPRKTAAIPSTPPSAIALCLAS